MRLDVLAKLLRAIDMSDLFIILGIVAALLIGGVAIYNKIQERKYRKRADEAFHHRHDDVLMGQTSEQRIEPLLGAGEPRATLGAEEPPGQPERPWVSTLPETPVWELPGEKNEDNRAFEPLPEPMQPVPPTGANVYEPRASPAREARPPTPSAKLYERPPDQPEKSRGAALLSREPRASVPPGSLREPPKAPLPPGALGDQRSSVPPGSLRDSPRTTVPPGSLRDAARSSIPPGTLSDERTSVPPGSLRDSAKTTHPPASLHDSAKSSTPPGSLRERLKAYAPPQSAAAAAEPVRTTRSIPPGSLQEPPRTPSPTAAGEQPAVRERKPAEKSPAKPPDFDPPHSSLDYVAKIELEKPLSSTAFSQLITQTRELGKPVRFAGLNSLTGALEELSASNPTTYKEVTAGLQMADRSGPATDVQIARFGDMLRRAATGLRARAICPPLHQALASAIELDQFCADVDVTIGLNIVARRNQPFAGSRLAQLAEALGFRLAANGNFEFCDDTGAVIFSLCDQDGAAFNGGRINGMSTKGVTLLLDVPRVADGLPAFETMMNLANDLSEPLGGVVVDDNGKTLSERGIENIRAQLREIYDKMQARQIPPGSPRARRLFS